MFDHGVCYINSFYAKHWHHFKAGKSVRLSKQCCSWFRSAPVNQGGKSVKCERLNILRTGQIKPLTVFSFQIFPFFPFAKMAKNKGLTPKRKKIDRNPRVKHREKFRRAKIRRKGQVRVRHKTSPVCVPS